MSNPPNVEALIRKAPCEFKAGRELESVARPRRPAAGGREVSTETYNERRERERRDSDAERGSGHETWNEQLDRWRQGWRDELDRDLENGR